MPDAVSHTATAEATAGRSRARWLVPSVVTMHLLAGFPYAFTGLVAPPYGVTVLAAVWVGLLVLGWRQARRGHLWALAVPLLTVAVWVLAIEVGDRWLGWVA